MLEWESFPGPFIAGRPIVHQDGGQLMLQFGPASIQSQMQVDDPLRLSLGYTRTLMGFLLFVPQPKTITMIGLGGGSLAKYCYARLADTRIDVVEINADVIALRERFFIPPNDARFEIHCDDGAAFIATRKASEDVIIVDGFDLDGQAPSLCTEKFYTHCYNALTDNGVMAVNLSENHRHHSIFITRMRNIFADNVMLVGAENCTNKIVFAIKRNASHDTQLYSEKSLLARAAELDKQHPIAFRQLVERMGSNRHNALSKD